jgi:hypothetical protein
MILKSVFLIAIVAVAMFGVMVTSVFSQMGSDGIPCGGQWTRSTNPDTLNDYVCTIIDSTPAKMNISNIGVDGNTYLDNTKYYPEYPSGKNIFVDIELIDHFVNGKNTHQSFGENYHNMRIQIHYGTEASDKTLKILPNEMYEFGDIQSYCDNANPNYNGNRDDGFCYSIKFDEAVRIELKPPIGILDKMYTVSAYLENGWHEDTGFRVLGSQGSESDFKSLSNDEFSYSKLDGNYRIEKIEKSGGCLIATATYGSEMAIEVQQLRELRDNQLLQTESGTQFMGMFNDVYYSFSPTIADMEREHPMFKEVVKLAITPMISSLSLMENANSESEVLSIGLSVIMLNIGMYLGVPAVVIVGIRKRI